MSSWDFGEVCYNGGLIRPPVKPALKGDGNIGKQTSCAWVFKPPPLETSLLKRELFTMEVPINQ